MKNLKITIKTPYGFENPLEEELNELGYNDVKLLNRAVQLKGDWEDVYRLNYHTRLAISVLVEVKSFTIHNEKDLYDEAKKIDWTSYFDVDKTFAVKGAVFSTLFQHSQYPLLVVKDAIADTFREKFDKRPDVNIKSPQVMFDVYIKDKSVVVSLNTSGVPLFQRGYRQETGEAPMNEVLAAGILRLSGWDRKSTLIDPMCGSGTIAIEAALWAANIPSMIERSHYAFKNFTSFDAEAWEKVRNEGNKRPIDLGFDILAYDIDGEMVQKAKRNSKMAPIGNMITFERKDALTLSNPNDNGILICNPPYEERMGEDVEELYEGLGDTFKSSFVGYNCWVISSNIDALKHVGLKPSKKFKVFNGSLECSFRQYQIFEGSRKEKVIKELNPTNEEDVQPVKKRNIRQAKKEESDSTEEENVQPIRREKVDPIETEKEETSPIEKKIVPRTEKKDTPPTNNKYSSRSEGESTQPTSSKYARKTEKEDSPTFKKKEVPRDEKEDTQPTEQVKNEKTAPEKPKEQEKAASKYQSGVSKYLKKPSHLKYASSSKEENDETDQDKEKDQNKTKSEPTESTEKEESLKEKIERLKKERE